MHLTTQSQYIQRKFRLNYQEMVLWTDGCVPSKVPGWNPAPQCDAIWRWSLWAVIRFRRGHEWGVRDGISTLRWHQRASSLSLLILCTYCKKATACKPEKSPSPDNASAGTSILGLPNLQNNEKWIWVV